MHRIVGEEHEILNLARVTATGDLILPGAPVTRLTIQAVSSSRTVSEEKYAKIRDWLSGSPWYSHHVFSSRTRLLTVGKWLLRHPEYIDWQMTSYSSLLLLQGVPGSGKTTLCSVVVDDILTTAANNPLAAPFGCFYCADLEFEKSRASSDHIMRSILGQLAMGPAESRIIRDILCYEYERQSAMATVNGQDVPELKTRDCVQLILELAEEDPLTIVVDSLDSVAGEERLRLINALEEIAAKSDNVVKILTTSTTDSQLLPSADKKIQITAHEVRDDMEFYVRSQAYTVVKDRLLLQGIISPISQETMIQTLVKSAGEK